MWDVTETWTKTQDVISSERHGLKWIKLRSAVI